MDLYRYLEKTKQSQAGFARLLGVAPSYVSMLLNGKVWPTRRFMLRVLAATQGQVTPNDLIGVDLKAYRNPQQKAKRNG